MLNNLREYYDQGETYILQNPFNDTLLARLVNVILHVFDKYSATNDFAKECHNKYKALWDELTNKQA